MLAALILYFIPSFWVLVRNTDNKWQVIFINTFLGWTIIGWIAAWVMAKYGD